MRSARGLLKSAVFKRTAAEGPHLLGSSQFLRNSYAFLRIAHGIRRPFTDNAFHGTERVPSHAPCSGEAMPASVPALPAEALGILRQIQKFSLQPPGDWSGMGSDWWDIGEGAHQYELAFMTYTLGMVQCHYTPAYRDFCQPTMERLVDKMMSPDIWSSWFNASRGGRTVDPDQQEIGMGWLDPLKKHNIMYKGHLLQMSALYEAIYRAGRFVKPGAFTFEFKAATWGMGPETFRYDLNGLARIVYDEYVESNYEGVQCEPNRVFGMCNQHAILGLLHHDTAFGTAYAAEVMPKFMQTWLHKGYTDCNTGSHMRLRWVKQDHIFPACDAWSDGWTGIFMHAWQRDFIQSLYPAQRARHLDALLSGKESARVATAMVPTSAKVGFGMFIALAAEVGDMEARDLLLAYAKRNFQPKWEGGRYYYPRNDNWTPDENGDAEGVDILTANALLPMALINPGNGLWRLYNELPAASTNDAPFLAAVDHERFGVSQAWHDRQEEALHLILVAVEEGLQTVTFEVHKLNPERSYVLLQDDSPLCVFTSSASVPPHLRWPLGHAASVRCNFEKEVRLTIRPYTG
jgi:hypothetical protein